MNDKVSELTVIKDFYNEHYGIKYDIGILKFLEIFKDDDVCLHLIFLRKWFNKNCPKCDIIIDNSWTRYKNRKSFKCSNCSYQIYPCSGTIFEKSTTPLHQWFYLLYNTSSSKKNISALQGHKNIEQCYKTTHRMMKMIRFCLSQVNNEEKFKGVVEIDEMFMAGGNKWSRWGSICKTRKQPILGFFERNTGKVKIVLVDERDINTLTPIILDNVEENSILYTDGWRGYNRLYKHYNHDYVEHSRHEYARGEVHTNNIENFWGICKRTIRGAHVKVGYEYVQNYLDEIVWKYNNRHKSSLERFDDLLQRAINLSI